MTLPINYHYAGSVLDSVIRWVRGAYAATGLVDQEKPILAAIPHVCDSGIGLQ